LPVEMTSRASLVVFVFLLTMFRGAYAQGGSTADTQGTARPAAAQSQQVAVNRSARFPDLDERLRIFAVAAACLGGLGFLVNELRKRADKR
jgi:hypothetical protein